MDDIQSAFFSYARSDLYAAKRLCKQIEAAGQPVWVDLHGIEPTQEWLESLFEAVDDSNAVVFLVTQASLNSPFCRKEVDYASTQGKRIIPILLGDIDTGLVFPVIRNIQWIVWDGEESLGDAIFEAIHTDRAVLDQLDDYQRQARLWSKSGHSKDLLWNEEVVLRAMHWLGSQTAAIHTTELFSEFLAASKTHSEKQRRRKRARRRGFLGAAGFLFSVALIASFVGVRLSGENTAALEVAEDRQTQSSQLIDFLLNGFLPELSVYGDYSVAIPIADAAANYYQAVDENLWSIEERVAYSRFGHLYAELKFLNNKAGEALALMESVLNQDRLLWRQDEANSQLAWNLGFSHFYIAQIYYEQNKFELWLEHNQSYYDIAVQFKDVSLEWKYEYLNAVFNVISASLAFNRFKEAYTLYDEISSLAKDDRSIFQDFEDFWVDIVSVLGTYENVRGNYNQYLERRSEVLENVKIDSLIASFPDEHLRYIYFLLRADFTALKYLNDQERANQTKIYVDLLVDRISEVYLKHPEHVGIVVRLLSLKAEIELFIDAESHKESVDDYFSIIRRIDTQDFRDSIYRQLISLRLGKGTETIRHVYEEARKEMFASDLMPNFTFSPEFAQAAVHLWAEGRKLGDPEQAQMALDDLLKLTGYPELDPNYYFANVATRFVLRELNDPRAAAYDAVIAPDAQGLEVKQRILEEIVALYAEEEIADVGE